MWNMGCIPQRTWQPSNTPWLDTTLITTTFKIILLHCIFGTSYVFDRGRTLQLKKEKVWRSHWEGKGQTKIFKSQKPLIATIIPLNLYISQLLNVKCTLQPCREMWMKNDREKFNISLSHRRSLLRGSGSRQQLSNQNVIINHPNRVVATFPRFSISIQEQRSFPPYPSTGTGDRFRMRVWCASEINIVDARIKARLTNAWFIFCFLFAFVFWVFFLQKSLHLSISYITGGNVQVW